MKMKCFSFHQHRDGIRDLVITSQHSLAVHLFVNSNLSSQKEPYATHFCQLRISHVFDDVSWEFDVDRLKGKAPSILHAYPQN